MPQIVPGEPGTMEKLHHPATAKRVIYLFMAGGPSHIDMFDYKPMLIEKNGEAWDPGEEVTLFQSKPGHTMASPWPWPPRSPPTVAISSSCSSACSSSAWCSPAAAPRGSPKNVR